MSVSNESKSVSEKSISNKSISDKSNAHPRQIQDALIRTLRFWYLLDFEN